ncbi:sensor histidine kinase [Paenibacillaceae bacterium WGS1546]|uniref:sensor histidine kinase n=1 Tax=Cohnella sp. WGS1546 TaxID=3366810 RepID=UPI00372D3316
MLFVWIALWAVALVLLLADPRSSANRWLSAVALCGGSGALAATLSESFLPYLREHHPHRLTEDALYAVQAAASLTSYYGLPYAFLLFALAYGPVRLPARSGRWLPLALFLPIALGLLLTPGYNEYEPVAHAVIVWWAVPYILVGACLVLFKKTGHRSLSHTHWMICLAVLPTVLLSMVMSYVLPSLGMLGMWRYNVWFVGIGVAVFLIGLFTYGFLGIRLLVDRRRLDSTMRAVTTGTAILHHAIKNDAGKMRLFTDKMRDYAERTNQPELLEDLDVVRNATLHIQEMIGRVHRRTEDLAIRTREVRLDELVRDTLKPFSPKTERMQLTLELAEGWRCEVDPVQVGEALNNVVANAIEATGGQGRLSVSLKESKRELTVEVRDSGPGMTRSQAARALEPFFTTKGGKEANFGLGLPYAYHVMRKHGGSLHIRSKPGQGTTVYLTFAKRAVRARKADMAETIPLAAKAKAKEAAHGEH